MRFFLNFLSTSEELLFFQETNNINPSIHVKQSRNYVLNSTGVGTFDTELETAMLLRIKGFQIMLNFLHLKFRKQP